MRACAVETHVKISQEPLYTEFYRKNAAAQNHSPHLVRACAVYTEIYKKNAAAQSEDPDQAPAFTLTVRTPQSKTHCLGNKKPMCFSWFSVARRHSRKTRNCTWVALRFRGYEGYGEFSRHQNKSQRKSLKSVVRI